MYKQTILPAILIAILALFLSERTIKPVRNILGTIVFPFSEPLTEFTQSIRSVVSTIREISTLRLEVIRLRDENRSLSSQVAELAATKQEQAVLEKALGFKNEQNDKIMVARVIGRSPERFLQTIEINKGETDGIKLKAPVVSDGYLVGQIEALFKNHSTVRLITSSDSLIAVVSVNSRGQGLLKGGLDGLVMTKVPLDIDVKPDEPVITSGLGGIIPANIPVGLTRETRTLPSDVLKEIRINSPVSFSRLELVFVGEPIAEE